jgi:site-specific DNA recombinase
MARSKDSSSVFSQDRPVRYVALYARVSTLHGQQDPEMQLSELREYATRRGLSIYQEYVDQGVSGSKEFRPALNRLMSDAQRCRFDAVSAPKARLLRESGELVSFS